jgi:hypothetical protein
VSTSADVSVSFDDELAVGLGLPQPLAISLAAAPLSAGITQIPKIAIGADPLTLNPLTVTLTPLTIEPVTIDVKPLDINVRPLDLTFRVKEIPSLRVHLPANFSLGLSLFGRRVFSARLCGEAQVINEPYRPNACERCGATEQEPTG